jgi:hypothetical protein
MPKRPKATTPGRWERPAIFVFGVVFVVVLIVLGIFFPTPTESQDRIFRTVLALAAAGVAALIPGLLHIDTPWLRAGGALAVFVLIFKFSPATLIAPVVTEYRVCAGEYERACQPHDVYQYCDVSTDGWAKARCSSFKVIRLDTKDGNKCGYLLDRVICTGPK